MKALLSLMDDSATLQETIAQWMSTGSTHRQIDSEIGTLLSDAIGPDPHFTYARYDLPFERDVTLTQLIALAGGLMTSQKDLTADTTALRLIRTVDGKRKSYRISFDEIMVEGKLGKDVRMQDGDLVYVPPRTWHQFRADARSPLGFLCLVPCDRDRPVRPDAATAQALRTHPTIGDFIRL